jgi:two-component system sensor histidine kinase BarA
LIADFKNISDDEAVHDDVLIDIHSPLLICDEQRIMQVLLCLQSNALKFTEKGYVKIEVSVEKKDKNKYLRIAVIDTGIGIEYEDQDKLFKLFGFVQDAKQMNKNGIGLGLVIADNIVSQFNGQIDFESEPG